MNEDGITGKELKALLNHLENPPPPSPNWYMMPPEVYVSGAFAIAVLAFVAGAYFG